MIIYQITDITCNYVAEFTADEKSTNTLESNVNINISDISNFDTRYGNIQSKRSKQVDYSTLYKRWNIDRGKAKKTLTRKTKCRVWSCLYLMLGRR